jgi:SAM-dependent methyltransferase
LREQYTAPFTYLGVDFSQALIAYAKKDNPKMEFVCEDISEFIVRQPQESFDVIIGTASFQHIPSFKEMLFLMKHFHRVLRYDGIFVMINWAYSRWFFKRFWKELVKSVGKWLISFGRTSRRDVFVPWTSRGKVKKRYYHLLSLNEIKKLTDFSGLCREELCYLDVHGHKTLQRKQARNSFLVARKSPIE